MFLLDDQFSKLAYAGIFSDTNHVHSRGHDFFGDRVSEFHDTFQKHPLLFFDYPFFLGLIDQSLNFLIRRLPLFLILLLSERFNLRYPKQGRGEGIRDLKRGQERSKNSVLISQRNQPRDDIKRYDVNSQ